MKQIDLYCHCGTFGHAWDPDPWEGSKWKPEFGTPVVVRCLHCTSERRDVIGTNGRLISRKYWHPENYKFDKGMRPSRDEFRLAWIKYYKRSIKEVKKEIRDASRKAD